MTTCDICNDGKDYKNIAVHKRFKHKSKSSNDPAGTILKPTIISPIDIPSPADDNHKKVFELSKELWWIQMKLNNIILFLLFLLITVGYFAYRYKV